MPETAMTVSKRAYLPLSTVRWCRSRLTVRAPPNLSDHTSTHRCSAQLWVALTNWSKHCRRSRIAGNRTGGGVGPPDPPEQQLQTKAWRAAASWQPITNFRRIKAEVRMTGVLPEARPDARLHRTCSIHQACRPLRPHNSGHRVRRSIEDATPAKVVLFFPTRSRNVCRVRLTTHVVKFPAQTGCADPLGTFGPRCALLVRSRRSS